MGKNSEISWTHHTFNPWWGCTKVSAGCTHCYAETFSKRVGEKVWGDDAPRRFFGEKHWAEPLAWNAAAKREGARHRVFCASMADVFEDRIDLDLVRARLFDLIHTTPNLDWLLLTKRPEMVGDLVTRALTARTLKSGVLPDEPWRHWFSKNRPMENVWIGTTVENQEVADVRIPHLLAIPARVHFLSCEPMLGPVDVHKFVNQGIAPTWVIVGGESGPGARPFDLKWARDIVLECMAAHTPVFVKQLGADPVVADDSWGTFLLTGGKRSFEIKDRKGADKSEWPADLVVQQFPAP